MCYFFFFKQKTAYEMRISDWSSDVCSSDLIRKQVVEYDNVMNDQRKVIYEQRGEIIDSETVDEVMTAMRAETVNSIVADACPPGSYPEQWDVEAMKERVANILDLSPPIDEWMQEDAVDAEIFEERIQQAADAVAAEKAGLVDAETWKGIEKSVLHQTLDHHWKEHPSTPDALRQVLFLRAYAQKETINEYKQEARSAAQTSEIPTLKRISAAV